MKNIIRSAANKYTLLLVLVLAASFAIRVYNLDYNSPFLDEAVYIVLGKKVLTWTWQAENPFGWVGGMPLFYSPIAAIASTFNGIIGARFISVILGTASVFLMYKFSARLRFFGEKEDQNKLVGLVAATFLGVSPVAVWLSRMAIYDILAFSLVLLGLASLQIATDDKKAEKYLWPSAIFFLSFLAKYTVLMLFPFVTGALLIYTWSFKKDHFAWVAYYFVLPLALSIGVYFGIYFTDLIDFFAGKVNEAADVTLGSLVSQFWQYTFPWYLLAILGVVKLKSRKQYQAIALFGFSLIPLFVHLLTKDLTILTQNTVFTLIFLLPVAAVFIVTYTQKDKVLGTRLLLASVIALFIWSRVQHSGLEQSWPNSREVMEFLKVHATEETRILAEADDVAVIALSDKVSEQNITGPFYFEYQGEEGDLAYANAVSDGYFSFIQLEAEDSTLALTLEGDLDEKYDLVYDQVPFRVYELKSQ